MKFLKIWFIQKKTIHYYEYNILYEDFFKEKPNKFGDHEEEIKLFWEYEFIKFNNKYDFKKKLSNFNKKNFCNSYVENLINFFNKTGNKNNIILHFEKGINDFYNLFLVPDEYDEYIEDNQIISENYTNIKNKLFSKSFYFDFNNYFDFNINNYSFLFDFKKINNNNVKRKKLKNEPKKFELIYIRRNKRLKHFLKTISIFSNFEKYSFLEDRFFNIFAQLFIKPQNSSLFKRKISIYKYILKKKKNKK